MRYSKLEYYLSQPRLQRFLLATGNSRIKAQKLYRVNLRVSQAFYPILNLFEIFLRNSVNYHVSNHFSNPNWIISEKTGFMSNASLAPSQFFLKKSIQKAERAIRRKGSVVTSGKVIAEQSFGFWTSLLDTHHFRLIGGSPLQAFPLKPAHANRRIINKKLNKIREFRNRIYHNEPICFNAHRVDFSNAHDIINEIYELLSWIDDDLTGYIEYFNGIHSKIDSAKRL